MVKDRVCLFIWIIIIKNENTLGKNEKHLFFFLDM